MGPTGVGKSTFIQAITGCQDDIVSKSLGSGTLQVDKFECQHKGQQLVLVDTPGTDVSSPPELTDEEVLSRISTELAELYKDNIVPFAIIFMQRISTPTTPDYVRDVAIFRAVCGDAFLPNVLLVPSREGSDPRRWVDNAYQERQQRRREQEDRVLDSLCTDPQFWQPLLRGGAQLADFNVANPQSSAPMVLDLLPHNSPVRPLLIQSEMHKSGDFKTTLAWRVASARHKWYCLQNIQPTWRCICGRDSGDS